MDGEAALRTIEARITSLEARVDSLCGKLSVLEHNQSLLSEREDIFWCEQRMANEENNSSHKSILLALEESKIDRAIIRTRIAIVATLSSLGAGILGSILTGFVVWHITH